MAVLVPIVMRNCAESAWLLRLSVTDAIEHGAKRVVIETVMIVTFAIRDTATIALRATI
jgi:hypothetical protein